MTAVRVRRGKVGARGKRGLIFSLSQSIAHDLGVSAGSVMSMYRGAVGGVQVVILASVDAPMLSDDSSVQGRELAEFIEAHKGGAVA